MNKKKTILVFTLLCLIASFLVIGCSYSDSQSRGYDKQQEEVNNEIISHEASEEYLTFEEVIDRSNCIVTARLKNIYNKESYREYDFTPGQTIIGEMAEKNFIVREGYTDYSVEGTNITYSTKKPQYEIGKEYLFLLNKDTKDSLIYTLSSVNSVVDLEKEKDIVEKITTLISK
jgi:hypothetical protein